jgi:hypothetical protein
MPAALLLLVIAEVWPASLVLPRRALRVDATVEINLRTREAFEPVSLAPDAWWGATDRLTVGVVTSSRALSRVEPGDGLCLRSEEHGCDRLYDNLALDGLWSLREGPLAVAARTRLVARSFADPFKPSVRPGVLARWRRGAFAIEADPHLQIGLANRDQGNRDQLSLPLWFRFQLGCRAAGYVHTGARGELIGFDEKLDVPFALGAAVRAGPIDVGVEAGFAALLGPQNQLAERMAYVFARWETTP